MNAPGDRIALVRTSDPWTKLRAGDQGTVTLVDSLGTVHVRWDSGSSLGLVPGEDAWNTLPARKDTPCRLPTTT